MSLPDFAYQPVYGLEQADELFRELEQILTAYREALNDITFANDQIAFSSGDGKLEGDANLTWSGTVLSILGADVYIGAGKYLYLDGGGNTWIRESIADTLQLGTNGVEAILITSAQNIVINNGYLDLNDILYLDDQIIFQAAASNYIYFAANQQLNIAEAGGGNSAVFDDDSTAGNTRMLLYDVDSGQIERVSSGANDSGETGYRILQIPNTTP